MSTVTAATAPYSFEDIHTFYPWAARRADCYGPYYINRRGDVMGDDLYWCGRYDGMSIIEMEEPELSTDCLVFEGEHRNWVPPAVPGGLATLVAPAMRRSKRIAARNGTPLPKPAFYQKLAVAVEPSVQNVKVVKVTSYTLPPTPAPLRRSARLAAAAAKAAQPEQPPTSTEWTWQGTWTPAPDAAAEPTSAIAPHYKKMADYNRQILAQGPCGKWSIAYWQLYTEMFAYFTANIALFRDSTGEAGALSGSAGRACDNLEYVWDTLTWLLEVTTMAVDIPQSRQTDFFQVAERAIATMVMFTNSHGRIIL